MARLDKPGSRVDSVLLVEQAATRVYAGDGAFDRVASAWLSREKLVFQQFLHQVDPTEEVVPHEEPSFDNEEKQ